LQFKHELARNTAIINQAAEQIVLIRDRQEARDFMKPRDNGRGPPNVRATLATHDSQKGCGHRFQIGAGGSESQIPIHPIWAGLSRMDTDDEYQLR
jgi:hypothetical protein